MSESDAIPGGPGGPGGAIAEQHRAAQQHRIERTASVLASIDRRRRSLPGVGSGTIVGATSAPVVLYRSDLDPMIATPTGTLVEAAVDADGKIRFYATSGAPTSADYLVKTATGGLSAERVVTDTATITWDWATGGQAKANIASVPVTALDATIGLSQGGTGATTAVGASDAILVKGADIASAATTNLATATGIYVHVTGTTTITALGTAAAGVFRIVRFSGALTLTHNATSLILPGAANITTTANDVATFVSEGSGNWRCVGYVWASKSAMRSWLGLGDLATLSSIDGATQINARSIPVDRIDSGATIDGEQITVIGGLAEWGAPA